MYITIPANCVHIKPTVMVIIWTGCPLIENMIFSGALHTNYAINCNLHLNIFDTLWCLTSYCRFRTQSREWFLNGSILDTVLNDQVGRLLHIQNRVVRVVFSFKKFDHVSVLCEQLSWPEENKIHSLAAFHCYCFSSQFLKLQPPIKFGRPHKHSM